MRDVAMSVLKWTGAVLVWLGFVALGISGFAGLSGSDASQTLQEGAIRIGALGLLIERWIK